MPIHIPDSAGKPYRPSNGTEGSMFEARFCERCAKFSSDNDDDGFGDCHILLNALQFDVGDDGYPSEWIFDDEGKPKCTAFETLMEDPDDE